MASGQLNLNLNPDAFDDNVVLAGSIGGRSGLHGTWRCSFQTWRVAAGVPPIVQRRHRAPDGSLVATGSTGALCLNRA